MRQWPLLMIIASVLSGLGIVQMTFLIGQSLYRTATWSSETRTLRAEVAQLEQDIAVLNDVRDHVLSPEGLATLARCQGFVGSAERVIVDKQATEPDAGNCDWVPLP